MSTFRNPPWFSVTTPIAAIMAIGRMLGRSNQVLTGVMGKVVSKDAKAKTFAGYEPTAHDVFVTVYSKSGTNWALQIVTQLAWEGQAEFGHIHEIVAWPEAKFSGITPLRDDSVWKASPTQLRGVKTSLPAEYVPYDEAATYVCVIRDPKEVLISGYYFITGLFGMTKHISLDEWFETFVGDAYLSGDWAAHTASYWAWRDRPNVLVLFYDELKRDLGAGVRRCAEVMGLDPSPEVLAIVEAKASFAHMKARGEAFNPPRFLFVPEDERSVMLRGGSDKAKREELTAKQRATIDELFMARLAKLGSDFPYAEHFLEG